MWGTLGLIYDSECTDTIKEDIKSWAKYLDLHFLNCACSVTNGEVSSKRQEVKELIKRNDNKNQDQYLKKPRNIPNFYFSYMNFEDFLALHNKEWAEKWKEICSGYFL